MPAGAAMHFWDALNAASIPSLANGRGRPPREETASTMTAASTACVARACDGQHMAIAGRPEISHHLSCLAVGFDPCVAVVRHRGLREFFEHARRQRDGPRD